MTRIKSGVCAALALAMTLGSVAPVAAQPKHPKREAYVERYYKQHGPDAEYRRWRAERHRWSERDYQRWYRRHHDDDWAAAAIFGLAAGAIAGAIMSNSGQSGGAVVSGVPSAGGYEAFTEGWYRYCDDKYQSFDPESGTYLGYDGERHYCQ